jgi:phosphate transport system substrate-binding protein
MKKAAYLALTALAILGSLGSCLAADREILGAGATFPYPLYSKMFDVYGTEHGVRVNYQAIGSGGGIRQLIEKTVAFGGTDACMTDEEIETAGAPIVHVPICLGAVVLTYNVPGNPAIKLTPKVLADIFLGRITQWNDSQIVALNPEAHLPDMAIVVVHRSDGSGTTFIFSDYLGKVSTDWKDKVGVGKSLNWPVGLGAKGNPGVAGLVKQLPGSLGYVELIYALQNRMSVALLSNKAGNFVLPTIKSVSAAAAVAIPPDTRVSITDTEAKDGYPISGFTWLILYQEQNYGGRSREEALELVQMISWMIHDGQQLVEPLQYSPLPKEVVVLADAILAGITHGGRPLLAK